MGTHTGHQQEAVGHNATHVGQHLGLGSAHNIHHIVGVAPFFGAFQHILEKAPPGVLVLGQLKIVGTFVGRKRQQDNPLVGIGQERRHRVLTHVGRNGERVETKVALRRQESARILPRSVADVAALGVGNEKRLLAQAVEIVRGKLKLAQSLDAHRLIKRQIGLVGHTIVDGSVDDSFVEQKRRVGLSLQMLGYLVKVSVKANAEERFPFVNQVNKFCTFHSTAI